jgi:hypothetical protein
VLDFKWLYALCVRGLGHVATATDEHDAAIELFSEALGVSQAIGERRGIARTLEGVACVASAKGQPRRALRLAGAANAIREQLGLTWMPSDDRITGRYMAEARQLLSDSEVDLAFAEGRAMTVEQAAFEALEGSPD